MNIFSIRSVRLYHTAIKRESLFEFQKIKRNISNWTNKSYTDTRREKQTERHGWKVTITNLSNSNATRQKTHTNIDWNHLLVQSLRIYSRSLHHLHGIFMFIVVGHPFPVCVPASKMCDDFQLSLLVSLLLLLLLYLFMLDLIALITNCLHMAYWTLFG